MSMQPTPPEAKPDHSPSPGSAASRISSNGFRLSLLTDPPGVIEVPPMRSTIVSIHVGPSVEILCRRAGYRHRGTAVHGDIDIIPPGTPSVWEVKDKDTAFVLSVSPELLRLAAEESGVDPDRVEIRNRFQERDTQLENIGWALKAEMESGYLSGRLYIDSLAVSVATRLIRCHSSVAIDRPNHKGRLSGRRLKEVLSYIEDNLNNDIPLREIAGVAGLSVSHFKVLFRESVGLPAHQYVIRRRVERAKTLLGEDDLPISQIALEAGFAHQSHLAYHMRRLTGQSPRAVRRMLR